MKTLLLLILFCSSQAFGQYYPRGTTLNNNYWPNVDEPNKWMITLDAMFDWQKERQENSQSSFQTTHANFNVFYGGKNFRGGAQVIHDFNRSVKDLSVGVGLAFNRPLFFELGVGYLNRVAGSASTEGWSYHGKVGYYFPWFMEVQYRTRFRIALVYNHKIINDFGDPKVTNFYPIIGFEFET